MGRTLTKYHDDDDDRRKKSLKPLKRSKNIPGQGMRVINNWSEDYEDDDSDLDYEYSNYTSQTQRK